MSLNDLDYEKLCLLVEYEEFYDLVYSKEKVEEYCNLLHKAYCKENKIKPTNIAFISGVSNSTYAYYDPLGDKIYLNEKFLDMYSECKNNKDSYYPVALLIGVIHESRHKWQHNNIKKMFDRNASNREKLSLYSADKKLYEATTVSNLKIKDNTEYLTSKQLIKVVKAMYLIGEFKLEYANSPCELDAEEEVISVLKKIYETTYSENSLNILLNFVEEKRTNQGLWFLSHEYYEDKDHPYNKRAFSVLKDVYMDYLKQKLKEHENGNHFYHEEEYVFSLYPCMSELISKIRESAYKIPDKSDSQKRFKRTFFNKVQSLPKRR